MQAGIYHLYIDQGASYSKSIFVVDEFNNPIDLTGYIVRGQIRKSAADSSIALNLNPTIVSAAAGKISFALLGTQTALLETAGSNYQEVTVYVWDIEIESASGVVTRLLNGFVYVSPEVTKNGG